MVGFEALLVHDDDGSTWLEGRDGAPLPMLAPGERLRVLTSVPGDATYASPGRVRPALGKADEAPDGPARCRIELDDDRLRDQQRRHVRVPTPEIDVTLVDSGAGGESLGDLLNVSAGGIRTATAMPDVTVGTQLQCVFELPGGRRKGVDVNLSGEVVWVGKGPGGRGALGIRFLDADESTQAKLTSWVFRQESGGTV